MTPTIDRRSLLLTGTLGAGALAVPGFAQTSPLLNARGFTHAVASGEPGMTSMLLWTRYVPTDGGPVALTAEIAGDEDFRRPAGSVQVVTGPWRDFTAKATIDGLKPGTRYFYRFVAPDGSRSPVGRTKTLPDRAARRFAAAVFSCSNIGFGYFNAYAHAAARGDVDIAIHLGDYIYEYGPDNYPGRGELIDRRLPEPQREIVALADYRLRYASYRADPDLAALHRAMPMIVSQDDHESANDSWEGGAQNHQPEDGDWSARKAAAQQAWHEWMPVSDAPWQAYEVGGLATLFRTDSRLAARTRPFELDGGMTPAALAAFRDGPWQDSAATMLGSTQESWLAQGLRDSVRRGQRWQVAGFGTIMGRTRTPLEAAGWITPSASERTRQRVERGVASSRLGIANNLDSWGGYPAARARFLTSAQAADANLIVLSGDSHNGWAYDLAQDGRAAGVEFAGQGVTSPGYESVLGVDPTVAAAAMVATNPELKWCDLSRRGYMTLTLTPDLAVNDWIFVDGVRTRGLGASICHRATVRRGAARMT